MTSTAALSGGSFLNRMVGAAALRPGAYEDVEADRGATVQAVAVVVLSSLAAGVGAGGFGAGTVAGVTFFAGVALVAWAAWAWVVYTIGTRIMPESATRSDLGEMLRTMGFATAPGMLRIAGVWPVLTTAVFTVSAIWMLLAMIVAVRQALDYKTTRHAVAVCVFGWVLSVAFAATFGFFFGPRVW